MHIWIIRTFCFMILGVIIFMTGRFLDQTLMVSCQTSYGLWLSSPMCMVSYLYFGVLELNCIMVHNINLWKYLLLLFLKFFLESVPIYILVALCIMSFYGNWVSFISYRDLGLNYLTGPIPASIGNLTGLQYL